MFCSINLRVLNCQQDLGLKNFLVQILHVLLVSKKLAQLANEENIFYLLKPVNLTSR
jgi:hypothetical protein